MAKILKASTVVRRGFKAVALVAGEEVPEWAADQVGDHLVAEIEAPVVTTSVVESAPVNAAEVAVPDASWTAAAIRKYAVDHSVDLGEASTKADMLAVIEAV